MTLDLYYCDPEELAENAEWAALEAAADALGEWEERPARVLDFIYRTRLIRLLLQRAPVKRLRELNDHLARVAHDDRREALDTLEVPYHARWSSYREILEDRIAALDSAATEQVLGYAHVAEILEWVAQEGEIGQKALLEAIDGIRSEANLTRVLNLMERNELIERRKVGREKRITPGLNAPPSNQREEAEPAPETGSATDIGRGISYLEAGRAA